MKLAQIQMQVTDNKTLNLWHAAELIQQVEADMVILPEMFCCPYDNGCFRAYGEAAGGAAYQMLSRAAAAAGCTACGSSTATGAAPPSGICCGRCTTSAVRSSAWSASARA